MSTLRACLFTLSSSSLGHCLSDGLSLSTSSSPSVVVDLNQVSWVPMHLNWKGTYGSKWNGWIELNTWTDPPLLSLSLSPSLPPVLKRKVDPITMVLFQETSTTSAWSTLVTHVTVTVSCKPCTSVDHSGRRC